MRSSIQKTVQRQPTTPRRSDRKAPWDAAAIDHVHQAIDAVTRGTRTPRARRPRRAAHVPQFQRILVAIDGSDASGAAQAWALEMARLSGGRVAVICVLAPRPVFSTYARLAGWKNVNEQMLRLDEENGRRVLDQAMEPLLRAKIPAKPILVRGYPAPEIERAAREFQADLLILGSHGHGGKERFLLGSVADSVKNRVPCSVLIAKSPPSRGPVLVPVDGSEASRLAATAGLVLAGAWRRPTWVYHVYEVPWLGWPEEGPHEMRSLLQKFQLPARPRGVHYLLDYGHPGTKVVEAAAERAPSLIVMGSRGLGGLRSLLVGSVSNRVAHEAKTSVLLVRGGR